MQKRATAKQDTDLDHALNVLDASYKSAMRLVLPEQRLSSFGIRRLERDEIHQQPAEVVHGEDDHLARRDVELFAGQPKSFMPRTIHLSSRKSSWPSTFSHSSWFTPETDTSPG